MRTLVLFSSPRLSGYTAKLVDEFFKRYKYSTVNIINLRDYNINFCNCCGACATGKCVIKDDMQKLTEAFLGAELIVLAFPVYFHNVPAKLKCVIDRMQPVYETTYKINNPVPKTKKLICLATKGMEGDSESICPKTIKYFADLLGASYLGDFVLDGTDDGLSEEKLDSIVTNAINILEDENV